MTIDQLIKELTCGLAFWEELYKEECKNNEAIVKQCALHILQLEHELEEAMAQHPDWRTMSEEQEQQIRKLLQQQNLLNDLLQRFAVFEHIVDKIADAYLRHSVAQADAQDGRLDLLRQAIRQRDVKLEEQNKTLDCFADVYTDLLRSYNELYELMISRRHSPTPLPGTQTAS